MVSARTMVLRMYIHGLTTREDKAAKSKQTKSLKSTKTAVECQKEHGAKRTDSRMRCFRACPQPKRSQKNIAPNERTHECVVFERAPSQKGIRVTRERRRREQRKFGILSGCWSKKGTEIHLKTTHTHIFKIVRPPVFSEMGKRVAPTSKIYQTTLHIWVSMKHCKLYLSGIVRCDAKSKFYG